MRIALICNGLAVNPDHVASVQVNRNYDSITINMADGKKHHIPRDYNKTIWDTEARVLGLLAGDPPCE